MTYFSEKTKDSAAVCVIWKVSCTVCPTVWLAWVWMLCLQNHFNIV